MEEDIEDERKEGFDLYYLTYSEYILANTSSKTNFPSVDASIRTKSNLITLLSSEQREMLA